MQPPTNEDPPLARIVQRDAIRDVTEGVPGLSHVEAIAAIVSAQVTAAAQARREAERAKKL